MSNEMSYDAWILFSMKIVLSYQMILQMNGTFYKEYLLNVEVKLVRGDFNDLSAQILFK